MNAINAINTAIAPLDRDKAVEALELVALIVEVSDDLDRLATIADDAITFESLGSTAADLAESLDGAVLSALLRLIDSMIRSLRDPERIRRAAARARARGHLKIAERRDERADKIEGRKAARAKKKATPKGGG